MLAIDDDDDDGGGALLALRPMLALSGDAGVSMICGTVDDVGTVGGDGWFVVAEVVVDDGLCTEGSFVADVFKAAPGDDAVAVRRLELEL